MKHIKLSITILTISLPILITFLFDLRWHSGIIKLIIIVIAVLTSCYIFLSRKINYLIWKNFTFARKIKNIMIGIIECQECDKYPYASKNIQWVNLFKVLYNTSKIKVHHINDKYSVIINACGEFYPEEDILNKSTFKRIRNYIKKGGIFVNVAGAPFYYAWSIERKSMVPMSKEIETYKIIQSNNQLILEPIVKLKSYSLINGLIYKYFKEKFNLNDSSKIKVYQEQKDKEIIGELISEDKNEIYEQRSIREPAVKLIPLLRAKSANDILIYPICAIPYGKGFLVTFGFNLSDDDNNLSNEIKKEMISIIVKVVNRIIEKMKKGYPYLRLDTN